VFFNKKYGGQKRLLQYSPKRLHDCESGAIIVHGQVDWRGLIWGIWAVLPVTIPCKDPSGLGSVQQHTEHGVSSGDPSATVGDVESGIAIY
jgi:hypothetical protein